MAPSRPLSKTFPNFSAAARWSFLVALLGLLIFNSVDLMKEQITMKKTREKVPYIFLGLKFSGLKEMLPGVERIGYYTDKNLDDNMDARQFAQAQYILAPIILDLNNTNHEYIIFDCSNEKIAIAKIKELGVIPLRGNRFGILLAKNPKVKSNPR